MEPSKRDRKLYRGRVSGWQGHHMERLAEDYVTYLNGNEPASIRFWTMEKRMKQDKKTPGVYVEFSKRNIVFDLTRFLQDEVIVFDDLDEFSEELKEGTKPLKGRFG